MTLDNESIDPNGLRCQLNLFALSQNSNSEMQTKIGKLVNLSDEELAAAKSIHIRGLAKAKDLEEDIKLSRASVLKYCKQLEVKGIVKCDLLSNANIKSTKIFSIADEDIKRILNALEEEDGITPPAKSDDSHLLSIINSSDFSQLSALAKEIIMLVEPSGTTAKAVLARTQYKSGTVSKYLKEFSEAGWLTRRKQDAKTGEYTYYPTDQLLHFLSFEKEQRQGAKEIPMKHQDSTEQSTSHPEKSSFATQLKKWIQLNRQIRELEQNLITEEGKDAEEILADLKKKDF